MFPRSFQYIALLASGLVAQPSFSDSLETAIRVETATNNAAIQSQKRIDSLSDKSQKMLEQYRTTTHQVDTLVTYNKYLNNLVESQQAEKDSLAQQLKEIENTQREIVPLILRMFDSLEKFVSLDLPFLPEERGQRLTNLKDMMLRADVTNAEKFRRIVEAYQVENDYGNTIEAYRSDLTLKGTTSSVDFLRLGRVTLYYQHFDGSETGYWNKETNKWQILSTDYRNAIRNGLRVARKETAPNILSLPIPAAEAGQ
jgi:septal ring factor EnvC (AmiA/AmiB activator)